LKKQLENVLDVVDYEKEGSPKKFLIEKLPPAFWN
jgi:hypothetical protein